MSIDAAEAVKAPAAADPGSPTYEAAAGAFGGEGPPTGSRSLTRQAVRDTLSNNLARAGLAWLGLLVFFAVFAPFLANTHPVAMKMGGQWSSPLLRNLTPPDVTLLVVTAVTAVLALARTLSFLQSVGTILWFAALSALLTLWTNLPWDRVTNTIDGTPAYVSLRSLSLGFLVPLAGVASLCLFWLIGGSMARRVVERSGPSRRGEVARGTAVVAGLCRLAALALWAVIAWCVGRPVPSRLHLDDLLLGLDAWALLVLPFLVRPPRPAARVAAVGAAALALLLILLPVRPPENVDYTKYRTWAAEGKVEAMYHTPIPYSPRDRLRDQSEARLTEPDRHHWLGTDDNASDLLSELIYASRIALSIGFIATGISVLIGVIVGGFMGYYAGLLDLLGMRFMEIFESIPRLFLLITVTAFVKDRNIYLMMVVLGLTGWTGYARFLRAEFFTLRKLDYVQAAIASGLPRWSLLFKHMLPNGLTPILVSTTFGVASAILYESVLSFFGIGLVDEASWGVLLQQARAGGTGFIWWIAIFPGLMIFLTVFSYNLVGEAVRDALDPKLRKRD